MIELEVKEWTKIRKRLKEEYNWKPSVFMIRSVMREQLGCTSRLHQTWNENLGHVEEKIFLDFYSEEKETLFRLKYL